MANSVKNTIKGRHIAVLLADGADLNSVKNVKSKLMAEGAMVKLVTTKLAPVKGNGGEEMMADKTFFNTSSVLYDAVYVVGGEQCIEALRNEPDAIHFVNEAYRHCKAIGADKGAIAFLKDTFIANKVDKLENDHSSMGLITNSNIKAFRDAIAKHRFWEREMQSKVPA